MTLPLLSLATAENWIVEPTLTVLAPFGVEIVTVATLAVTFSAIAVLLTPSDDAVIWVEPGPTPVAIPAESMVATLVALLDQVRTPPVSTVPSEFLTVAVNAWFCPTTIELFAGVTVMLAI